MSIDERRRLDLADAAKRALGDDAGITLMEMLPPVGWADVAARHDLDALRNEMVAGFSGVRAEMRAMEARIEVKLDARFERGFRQVIVTMSSFMVAGFLSTVLASLLR